MNLKIRAAAVSALALTACLTAACAVKNVTQSQSDKPDYYIRDQAQGAEYILRDCGGYIGVYLPGKPYAPQDVTDIEVAGLRENDRKLIEGAMPVSDLSELFELLQDFSS